MPAWFDITAWDWGAIVRTAISAGVGTIIVQGLLPVIRDARDRKRHAAYLALRLAVIFEEFGTACAQRNVENDHAHTSPDREYPDWNPYLPELPSLPEDQVGWLALNATNAKLASRCLDFRSRMLASNTTVNFCIEFYEDKLDAIMSTEMSERGLEAWKLAIDLRKRHHIAAADPLWDWPNSLELTLERAESMKKRGKNEPTVGKT